MAARELQPLHHIGMFHESEMQGDPGDASTDRRELYPLVRIDPRRIATDRRDQQHPLVQHAIVPQVMRQGERYARASRSEDRGGSGQAEGRVLEHPVDKLVLALPHSRSLALEHLVSRAPGQHQERDDARQQKREPAAREQLCRVGGNEDKFDDKQRSVDGRNGERVVAPLQGDQGCEDRGDRHQH